jgi:hypothetical protein
LLPWALLLLLLAWLYRRYIRGRVSTVGTTPEPAQP